MKILTIVARVLLGLVFVYFGGNLIHPYPWMHAALPPGPVGQLFGGLYATHFLVLIGVCQVIGGLLMLIGVYVTLGLVILGPVLVCIDFFHLSVAHAEIPLALFVTLLWLIVAWAHKHHLAGIFAKNA